MPVEVRNLRELNRALARADKDTRRLVRAAEREIAAPVKTAAEQHALTDISRIDTKSAWWKMRIGVTQKAIYVVPARRNRGGSKRPRFDDTLWDKAMKPAAEENEARFEAGVEVALEKMAAIFNRPSL